MKLLFYYIFIVINTFRMKNMGVQFLAQPVENFRLAVTYWRFPIQVWFSVTVGRWTLTYIYVKMNATA